jgi:hypothetical protein
LILLEDFDKFSGVSLKALENKRVPVVITTTKLYKIKNYRDIINKYEVVNTKPFPIGEILRRLNTVAPGPNNEEIAKKSNGDLKWAISQVEFGCKKINTKDETFDSIFDMVDKACENPTIDRCLSINNCDRNGVYKLVFENYIGLTSSIEGIAETAEGLSMCDLVSTTFPGSDSCEGDVIGVCGLYEPVVRAGARKWVPRVYSQVDSKQSNVNSTNRKISSIYRTLNNTFDPVHFQEFRKWVVKMCSVDTCDVPSSVREMALMGLDWDQVVKILSIGYFVGGSKVSDHRKTILKKAFENCPVKMKRHRANIIS